MQKHCNCRLPGQLRSAQPRKPAHVQGGDVGDDCVVKFYVKVNGEEAASDESAKLTGWVDWKKTEVSGVSAREGDEITVGMYVSCVAGGWGTMDEFCLFKE